MISAKCLINAKFASTTETAEYIAGTKTQVILDKFTATNTDAGAITLTIKIVPKGETSGPQHSVILARSIGASATVDLSEVQNQILNPQDQILIQASVGSKLVVRASGREIT